MFIDEEGEEKQYSWEYNDAAKDEDDYSSYFDGDRAIIDNSLGDFIQVPRTEYAEKEGSPFFDTLLDGKEYTTDDIEDYWGA